MKISFKKGFEFKGFRFAIKKDKLYRLPIVKNDREYALREVPLINITKNIQGYRLIREKKSLRQVKNMIGPIDIVINTKNCLNC